MTTARGITIVGASAGSGKTYRLTEEVTRAINPTLGAVPLEGLLAVTYTKKAHAELAARIRDTLVRANAFEEAMSLPLAYLGTVHAACLRLLQEFALDAGLSPAVDVVAEDQAKLLRQALESALTDAQREHIDGLARRFRLRYNAPIRRYDWLGPVGDIMELARGNRIDASKLAEMGERSADSLLALFPKPDADGAELDAALSRELAAAARDLPLQNDTTGDTEKAIARLQDMLRHEQDNELDWCDWSTLATLTTGKKSRGVVAGLREVAARYERHPRLHAELRALTLAIFDAARIGLSAYQDWKRDRRVVDYVDMLDGALDLVRDARVRAELSERLRFAVVDEFQDTSPIQLALFVELHKIAKRSVWVGDRKQCIFEYAGADPQLMDRVAAWVRGAGGVHESLTKNYRSRPELVEACSELFALAFARHGFSRDEVVVSANRSTPKELEALPPFGLWCLETRNKEQDAEAVAEGVRRLLAAPDATPVVDRTKEDVRPVRAGDVAVLVATNAEAKAVAGALHARGIRSALARAGLLKTPEGTLADAALRWLLDERDSLAAATIDALTGVLTGDPDGWLTEKLHVGMEPVSVPDWSAALSRLRPLLEVLSPSEVLDEALSALAAVRLCARWPDPTQRIANLDALRALAAAYEDRCAQEREGATVAGLVRYFDDMGTESLRRDEMLASDDQHVPTDDGAVTVATYHKAKGLEWPVVVLASLDRAERRDAFEVLPESVEGAGFDPEDPLSGRWIRYWPWPFGQQEKLPLRDYAAASAEGVRVADREDKERARLLYVGFTRARDHLVLAVRVAAGKPKAAWLDGLCLADETPLLELCTQAQDGTVDAVRIGAGSGGKLQVPARVWRLGSARAEIMRDAEPPRWFVRGAGGDRAAYWIAPSKAEEDWPELVMPSVGEAVTLGGAMPVDAKVADDAALGDAVHAFLAADVAGLTEEQRLKRAQRLVTGAELDGVVRAEALVGAGDRLRGFVDARWPGATWRREVPVEVFVETAGGARRVNGIIDLLLETAEGVVIVDHKTFPAKSAAAWRMKSEEFRPQIGAYAAAVERAGQRVVGTWIHFPVGGGMLELTTADALLAKGLA